MQEKFKDKILSEVRDIIGENNTFSEDEWQKYLKQLSSIKDTERLFEWKKEIICEWKIKLIDKKIYRGYGSSLITRIINRKISRKFSRYDKSKSEEENLTRFKIDGQDYWKKWIKYGEPEEPSNHNDEKDQQERADCIERWLEEAKSGEEIAQKLIETARNYYEILEIPINRPSSNNPFPGKSISLTEVKKVYRKLSLSFHPDSVKYKNFPEKLKKNIFEKLQEANECLGDSHNKKMHDFYLYEKRDNFSSEYLIPNKNDSEEFEKLAKSVSNNELIQELSILLQNELKKKGISQDQLNEYVERLYKEKLEEFEKLAKDYLSKPIQQLMIVVKGRLSFIKEAWQEEQKLEKTGIIEEIQSQLTEIKPFLDKEELDNYESERFYDHILKEVRENFFDLTAGLHGKKPYETISDLNPIVEKLKKRALDKRKKKVLLTEMLKQWLDEGEKILIDKEIKDRKEKINTFINNFSEYLNKKKASNNYSERVISQNIQKSEKDEIENLISRLESWKEENYKEDSEEEIFDDRSATSNEEKQEFINYLNNLLFEYLLPLGANKNQSNLKKIRNNLSLNYEDELINDINRGKSEVIRAKTIRNVCETILTSGGSDEELVKKVKKINKSFVQNIRREVEKEIGRKIDSLPQEEQKLLSEYEKEISQSDFAKKLVGWKLKILKKNRLKLFIEKTIVEVNNYWTTSLVEIINKKKQEEILDKNWESILRSKTTENEVVAQKKYLKEAISKFKDYETKEQKLASVKLNEVLNLIEEEVELNKLRKVYLPIIEKLDWKRLNGSQSKDVLEATLNSREKYLIAKINAEKEYDNVENKIKEENNLNADYNNIINNLDWIYLVNSRTKTALTEAWTKRKSQLAEMAQRKQKQREEQARQQAEKEQNEKEEKENKSREELENGNEEERLNKKLETFRNSSSIFNSFPLISSFLSKEVKHIDNWFNELEKLLKKNDYQFLKEIFGEVPDNNREKLFSELNKEREKIKSEKDFGKSSYFTKIKENEIRRYLQEILKVVEERIKNDDEKALKNDIEELTKMCDKFEPRLNKFQKKLKKTLKKITNNIKSQKQKKSQDTALLTEKFVKFLSRVEKTKIALGLAREFAYSWLKGENLSDKEIQNQISILNERNFKTTEEVVQHLKKIIQPNQKNEIKEKNNNNNGKINTSIFLFAGLVFFLTINKIITLKKTKKQTRMS